jgi:hypothetical protein
VGEKWISSVSGVNHILRRALSRTPASWPCPLSARRESEQFLKKRRRLDPSGRSGVLLHEPRICRGSISKRSRHEEEARYPRTDSFVACNLCRLRILRRFIQAVVAGDRLRRELGQGRAVPASKPACKRDRSSYGETQLTVTTRT